MIDAKPKGNLRPLTQTRREISPPAKERLIRILRVIETPSTSNKTFTSAGLEAQIGWPRHTIRKDISFLADASGTNAGYDPQRLVPLIKDALGLNRQRKFCVVGLGRLGSAYLNLDSAALGEFELAAGFDTNVNRVEILKSPVPLYPAHKMGEVITSLAIEIALLCVPAEAAQSAAEKLAGAGIRGILNFAPVILKLQAKTAEPTTAVRNVYVTDELRALTVTMVPDTT